MSALKRLGLENLGVGMEVIDFQSGLLFQQLTEAIDKLRAGGLTAKAYEDADIPGLIRLHTNLNVTFRVDESDSGFNAYIQVPMIDRNHPFIQEWYRTFEFKDAKKALKEAGGKAIGHVNRKTSKIDGVFTKLQGKICITKGLFKNKSFTSGEVAAIILHECGHLFTYFEFLGRQVTTNYILSAASHACMGTDDVKEREFILVETEKALGIKIDNLEAMARTDAKSRQTAMQTVILSKVAERSLSETGTKAYDIRGWEQLSDQFATRHGAGKDLVTALDRMYRMFGVSSTMSTPVYLALEVCKTVWFCGMLTGFAILTVTANPIFIIPTFMIVAITCMINPTEKIYDDPKERMATVRRQLTEQLKLKGQDSEQHKQILDDLDVITSIEEGLKDRYTLLDAIWAYVVPTGKRNTKQETIQKELEELISNEMFIYAAKFKVGAAHV